MCPTILEVSFICLLGIAVIGKIGRHVRFLPQKKKKKKRVFTSPASMSRRAGPPYFSISLTITSSVPALWLRIIIIIITREATRSLGP